MKEAYERPEIEVVKFTPEEFCNVSSPDIDDF